MIDDGIDRRKETNQTQKRRDGNTEWIDRRRKVGSGNKETRKKGLGGRSFRGDPVERKEGRKESRGKGGGAVAKEGGREVEGVTALAYLFFSCRDRDYYYFGFDFC